MNAAKKLKDDQVPVPLDWEKAKIEELIEQLKKASCVAAIDVIWSDDVDEMAERMGDKCNS